MNSVQSAPSPIIKWAGIVGLLSGAMALFYYITGYFRLGLASLPGGSSQYFGRNWLAVVGALVLVAGSVLFLVKGRGWLQTVLVIVGVVFTYVLKQLEIVSVGFAYGSWNQLFYLESFVLGLRYIGALGPVNALYMVLPLLSLVAGIAAAALAVVGQVRGAVLSPTPKGYEPSQQPTHSPLSPSGVSEGWYPDPEGRPHDRYWDGEDWTERTRPMAPGSPVPSPQQRQAPSPLSARSSLPPSNGIGTSALVSGILGLVMFPVVFSVMAIVFGSIGIAKVNRGEATNKGVATTGLVLGIVGLVVGLILVFVLFSS